MFEVWKMDVSYPEYLNHISKVITQKVRGPVEKKNTACTSELAKNFWRSRGSYFACMK